MNFLCEAKKAVPLPWRRIAPRLGHEDLSISEVATLLTSEAGDHIGEMARSADALSRRRFGRTIKLYAPVYISNSCINGCRYCGFNIHNDVERRTLTPDEAEREAQAIMSAGHRHILLVAGEDPRACPIGLIEEIARRIAPKAAALSIEVQPFDEAGYRRLARAGVDGVTLYQESYDEDVYIMMHPSGPKGRFASRLEAIDAAGRAGMRFLGLGALLGLSDWRKEALALIAHARWLMKKHWRAAVTVSVPRIRDSASGFKMPHPVTDRDLAQMIATLRLSLPDCGIVLSTREPAQLRDSLLPLGITQMSAGSVTNPGGYTRKESSAEQFHLEDDRSPDAVAMMLKKAGYDPVWKDWDSSLHGS